MLPQGMLPADAALETTSEPTRTYKIDFQRGRISGMTDGLPTIRQFVDKTLRTRRFFHAIYSPNYGTELQANSSAQNVERWIKEALLQDDRILSINEFRLVHEGDQATVSFVVESVFGQMAISQEVSTNV